MHIVETVWSVLVLCFLGAAIIGIVSAVPRHQIAVVPPVLERQVDRTESHIGEATAPTEAEITYASAEAR